MSNRIEISEFGLQFLSQLPEEVREMELEENLERDEVSIVQYRPVLKGKALDFQSYANQTQKMLFRETSSLLKKRQSRTANNDSRRKLQQHHDHWVSQQRLVSHKLADVQARQQQQKISEYDWRSVTVALKKHSQNILEPLQQNVNSRGVRNRLKLKKLLVRKYPDRVVS